MNWIQHPATLEGNKVRLVPLAREHFAELRKLSGDPSIWNSMAVDGSDPAVFNQYLESAVLRRATGEQYAFTVIDRFSGSIIGSTMFHSMHPAFRKLEIGYTWYTPAYWRTGHNRECKLLLLTYCFEVLKTIRVQFTSDENNLRSRVAIERLGAKLEGILRNERIRYNGACRNTAMYSITDTEWPEARELILASLATHL